MLILGIETSCDETAAAVVADGKTILSNVIASQAELHGRFGGVVPEVASRKHVEAILPVIATALAKAHVQLADIDLIAVTRGPGLVGALLVGIHAAKGLAAATGIPLVGVHHIAGHIAANHLAHPQLEPPYLSLVASGGHSQLIHVRARADYETIAHTRDDAAGEAFDKVARAAGLGYPGGPAIERAARDGNPQAHRFPRTRFADGSLDFSFSGLKTAALQVLQRAKQQPHAQPWSHSDWADFAASFQFAVINTLAAHAVEGAVRLALPIITLAGGVSANQALRAAVRTRAAAAGIQVFWPPLALCTDNAAMIAAAGAEAWQAGRQDGLDLDAESSASLAV